MSLAHFDELQPSGGQIQSSATLRNQFNSLFQGDMYPLKVMAQDIQDNTVKVYSSNVNSYYQQVWVTRTQPLDFTEGNSPPIIAPASNNRITLLTINSAGTLEWNYGTEAGSPSAPNAPIGKLPLVQVYQRLDKSTIYDFVDDNGIDCYIIKDVRPVLMPVFYPENVKEILDVYDVNDNDLIDDLELLQIIDDHSNSIVSERVVNIAVKIWTDDLLISGLPGNLGTDYFNVFSAKSVDKYNALFYGGLGTLFEDPIIARGGLFTKSNVKYFGAKGDGVTDDTAAIQAAIDSGKTIYFPQPSQYYNITSDITIDVPFKAGLYQVFGGAGNVSFESGAVAEVHPEWWGVDGVDDDIQIQQAIDSPSYKTPVRLLAKTYNIGNTIRLNRSPILGSGIEVTSLRLQTDANCTIFSTSDYAEGIYYAGIRDLGLNGNRDNNTSGIGIEGQFVWCIIDNIACQYFADKGADVIFTCCDLSIFNLRHNANPSELHINQSHIGSMSLEFNDDIAAIFYSSGSMYGSIRSESNLGGLVFDNCSRNTIGFLNQLQHRNFGLRFVNHSCNNTIIGMSSFEVESNVGYALFFDETSIGNTYPVERDFDARHYYEAAKDNNPIISLPTDNYYNKKLVAEYSYPNQLLNKYRYMDEGNEIAVIGGAAIHNYFLNRDGAHAHGYYGNAVSILYGPNSAAYGSIPILDYSTDRDIVFQIFGGIPYNDDAKFHLNIELDEVEKNSSIYYDNALYNTVGAKLEVVDYIPDATTSVNCLIKLDGTDSYSATISKIEVFHSLTKNGGFRLFTGGLADNWTASGGTAEKSTDKYITNGQSQKFSGDTGEYIYQSGLDLVDYDKYKVKAKIYVESGSVDIGLGQVGTSKSSYHYMIDLTANEYWYDIDFIVNWININGVKDLRFYCKSDDTVFYIDYTYVAKLSNGLTYDETHFRSRVYGNSLIEIASTDATPTVRLGNNFKTNNLAATTITNFDNGIEGQEIKVVIGDANTTIDFTGTNLKGNAGADWSPSDGDFIECLFDGTNWYCSVSKVS